MQEKVKSNERKRYQKGDVVRINAAYNESLKEFHNHWGQIEEVYEYCYTVATYRGEIEKVTHHDLEVIRRASKEAAQVLIGKMSELLERYGHDPDLAAYWQFLGTKPVPGASKLTLDWFNFLSSPEPGLN